MEIEGLVGYWRFEEGPGSVLQDYSGKANHGVLKNGPTWVDGKIGGALEFDGTDDYVEVSAPSGKSLDPDYITMIMWVKFDNMPYDGEIALNKEGKYRMIAQDVDDSHLSIRYQTTDTGWVDGILIGDTALSADTWYCVAATYGGSKWKLYLNGESDGETSESGTLVSNDNALHIGSRITDNYFDGIIDEVRIYNRALSAAEIAAIYNAEA